MRSAQTGLFFVAALVAIIIGFFFTLIAVHQMLYKNEVVQCGAKCYHTCKHFKKIKACIGYVLKCINAIFLLWAVIVSSRTKTFFSDLSDQNCSDANYSGLLTDFSDQVDTLVYAKNRSALISFCVMVLTDIAKLVLGMNKKKDKGGKVGQVESIKPSEDPNAKI